MSIELGLKLDIETPCVIRRPRSKAQHIEDTERGLAEIKEITNLVTSCEAMAYGVKIRSDAVDKLEEIFIASTHVLRSGVDADIDVGVQYETFICRLPRCNPAGYYAVTDEGVLLLLSDSGYSPVDVKDYMSTLSAWDVFLIREDVLHILAYLQQETLLVAL